MSEGLEEEIVGKKSASEMRMWRYEQQNASLLTWLGG